MTILSLRLSLAAGRRHADEYRSTVGPCPRWDFELDALERALSFAPVRSELPETAHPGSHFVGSAEDYAMARRMQ